MTKLSKSTIAFSLDFGKGRNEVSKRGCYTRANVPSALNYLLAANSTCGIHSTEFRHVTSILMNRNYRSNTDWD
ncbi:Uncharacterized protein DBV15_08936 [Temnothorax longispinosus]|uniref:Uncharacterized protein n=1 Tax=Temnothorax longispinosus TaxID=300112 RepID=A0A4S2JFN4_9HYME|nr:Uncharacterized protein DBV15_08936 [Temnothorax longispinosus]